MATSPSTVQEVRRGSVHISSTVTSEKCTRSTPRRLARQQRGGPQDRIQNNNLRHSAWNSFTDPSDPAEKSHGCVGWKAQSKHPFGAAASNLFTGTILGFVVRSSKTFAWKTCTVPSSEHVAMSGYLDDLGWKQAALSALS